MNICSLILDYLYKVNCFDMANVERKNGVLRITVNGYRIQMPEKDIYKLVGELLSMQKEMKYERQNETISAQYKHNALDSVMDKKIDRDEI